MITLNMQFLRVGVSRGKDFFKTIIQLQYMYMTIFTHYAVSY